MSRAGAGLAPGADRELVGMALICALGAVVTGVSAALMAAAALVVWWCGGPWVFPTPPTWWGAVWRLLADPSDPRRALGPPWTPTLSAHPVGFWATATVLLLAGSVAVVVLCWLGWRRFGPTRAGHATRAAMRAELSVEAAREKARYTRPTMPESVRRRASLTEVGTPMHVGPIGPLCVPFENPTGTIAPTQSGKSRRALAHQALGAQGALLCSTTKPDLLELTGLARARRPQCGPVLVFDATGAVVWPALVRWSPVAGCEVLRVAVRRAAAMVEAAATGLRGVSAGNDKVFRDRAKIVLSAYLFAAALHGRDMASVLRWAMARSVEPADLLDRHGAYASIAENLRRETSMVAETADAVWMSVRRVLEPLLDPTLLALCTPASGEGFDAGAHIAAGGSLYLIAGESQAGAATPILTALAEHWIETAREMALHAAGRRLDPPATAVLDELTNATPVPELPAQVSDSAGRGVLVHWAAQSRAGLEEAYGRNGADLLIDNTTLLTIWGGLKHRQTLEWVSALTGHYERRRYQVQTDGVLTPGRTAIGTETVPVYRPGDVRKLPRNEVLIIHRALEPIRAKTIDVSGRPDWAQLRADVAAVRAGTAPIDAAGNLYDPCEPRVVTPRPAGPAHIPAPHPAAPSPRPTPWS